MKTGNKKDIRRASNIADTAEVLGLSISLVQKVMRTDRKNDRVIDIFFFLDEGKQKLMEEAKKLIPFN